MVKETSVKKLKTSKIPKVEVTSKPTSVRSSRGSRRLIKLLVVVGALIFLGSIFAWCRHVANQPDNVFWGAIENNLRSLGASRRIAQKDGNITSTQYVQFVATVPHVAKGTTKIEQNTKPPISIVTETLGTPYKDFVRYTNAQTSQKTPDGSTEDFSSILNVWGVSGTEPGSGVTGGQFYADSILNIVPSASLNYSQRKEVMNLMRDRVYTINEENLTKQIKDGRPQYIYVVQIDFEGYITALKQVASYVGLTQLDDIDPASYAGRSPVTVEIAVDVWSRSVIGISTAGSSRSEAFLSRGITTLENKLPEDAIPLELLQSRINAIDQEQ